MPPRANKPPKRSPMEVAEFFQVFDMQTECSVSKEKGQVTFVVEVETADETVLTCELSQYGLPPDVVEDFAAAAEPILTGDHRAMSWRRTIKELGNIVKALEKFNRKQAMKCPEE